VFKRNSFFFGTRMRRLGLPLLQQRERRVEADRSCATGSGTRLSAIFAIRLCLHDRLGLGGCDTANWLADRHVKYLETDASAVVALLVAGRKVSDLFCAAK
jgi:hypothetical protein